MAKKKLDKEAERTPSSPSKILAVFKNETIHFVIGLMLVIFSVYLLLAFSSFFFTGAADQSIIDSGSSADLAAVNNQVKNYAGSRGAQLASYLINDCFGVSSFFILVFLAVAGLKLMRVRGLSAAHSCWSGSPYSSDLPLWIIIRIPSFIWEVCTDIMSVVG